MLLELAGPSAGHGLQSALAATVEGQVFQSDLGADTRDVDDAARAVVGEEGLDGLGEEDGPQDVDGVDLVEILGGDGLEGHGVEEGRAVDEDIDLRRARLGVRRHVVLYRLHDLSAALGGAKVGADGDGLDIVGLGELRGESGGGGVGGVGEVDQEDVRALGGEVLGDGGPNALMALS